MPWRVRGASAGLRGATSTVHAPHLLRRDARPDRAAGGSLSTGRPSGRREALAAVLLDRDAAARSPVAPATRGSDNARVVEPLSVALADDPDAEVRRLAARALATLAWLADEEALEALDRARADPDSGVREVAAAVRRRQW